MYLSCDLTNGPMLSPVTPMTPCGPLLEPCGPVALLAKLLAKQLASSEQAVSKQLASRDTVSWSSSQGAAIL